MIVKKLAAIGVMSALLVGLTGAVAQAATTTGDGSSGSTCLPNNQPDTWPASVEGQPARTPGVTVWHDANGWHVRVTHNSIHDRVFSGEIATKGSLTDVQPVRLEKNDVVKVGSGGHALAFRFNNHGGVDGFDFNTSCAPALEFGFLSDGHRVPTGRIALGADGHHPAHNPFVIKRTATA